MKKLVLALTLLMFFSVPQARADFGYDIEYQDGEAQLMGYWADSQCNDSSSPPVIVVVPQWKGISYHERQVAHKLARICYNVFVADMYGKDIRPETNEQAKEQSSKYKNDPALGRQRVKAALNFAKQKGRTTKAAVMGYCFGGTMALEAARSGEDVAAAISFHGGLSSKAPSFEEGSIKAPILVHHGDKDPLVPAKEVDAFFKEMETTDADWTFNRYADAVHGFTQKSSGNDPSTGVAYNRKADDRSWLTTLSFLELVFRRDIERRPIKY